MRIPVYTYLSMLPTA